MCNIERYIRFAKVVFTNLQCYTYQEDTGVKNAGLEMWRLLDLSKLYKQLYYSIHNKKTLARIFSEIAMFIDLQKKLKQVYNSIHNGDTLARGTLVCEFD